MIEMQARMFTIDFHYRCRNALDILYQESCAARPLVDGTNQRHTRHFFVVLMFVFFFVVVIIFVLLFFLRLIFP